MTLITVSSFQMSLSHVALLVPSVEESAAVLKKHGVEAGEPETFESEGTKEVYVGSYASESGLLLLLEAISEGPYLRAFKKRGPSLHHIALDVSSMSEFKYRAKNSGWTLHKISRKTSKHGTAWFYARGVPTLLEVCEKSKPSVKPQKVSKLELPISSAQLSLLKGVGLDGLVENGEELTLTVDGKRMAFHEIATRSNVTDL